MKQQIDLLRSTPWDVLVILDACRWDAFQRVVGDGQAVRSPANCTPAWCNAVLPILQARGARYVTANPVVNRTYGDTALPIVSVWHDHWARFHAERIPTVHPMSTTALGILKAANTKAPVVVHYMQPHSPYIGTPPLAAARISDGQRGPTHAMSKLERPDRLVEQGALTWEDVRAAYRGNLRLAWEAVQALLDGLAQAGRAGALVVITADHGEVLGERGRFGHEAHWVDDVLYRVPWLERRVGGEIDSIRDRLEALGYV